jgi:hypothetical protein
VATVDAVGRPGRVIGGVGLAVAVEDTVTAGDVVCRQATTAFRDRTRRGLATPLPDSIEGVAALLEGPRPEVPPGAR